MPGIRAARGGRSRAGPMVGCQAAGCRLTLWPSASSLAMEAAELPVRVLPICDYGGAGLVPLRLRFSGPVLRRAICGAKSTSTCAPTPNGLGGSSAGYIEMAASDARRRWLLPQRRAASTIGSTEVPYSVSGWMTGSGTPLPGCRATMPSAARSRSCSVRTFAEMSGISPRSPATCAGDSASQ